MYPPQTPQTTTNRQPSIDSTTHARYGSRGRADREISASPSVRQPSMAPLQVPRYVDDDGTEYWKQPTKGVRPRWDNDGYGKGRKAVPSSMELILQFFEADSRNWSRFKAGSSGQKGVSVADNIRQFMIRNRAQWARSPDKIKLHVEDFYRNTFQPALSIANDTGVGEGSKVIFKGQTWEIQDLSEDLEKMCPRFKRWRDVIGDKTAVYRDLTGSIDTLASNSDTLGSFGLSLGRAGARDGDAVLIDEEDVYEYLDDPETDVDADSVVSGTPAPPRSLRSLPGSYSSQHEDSASSLASGSSRKSGRSSAMEIKAFGLETEKTLPCHR
ncbi:uncharacterized protein COLE_02829 [Cutaneotrichosporon oleaginosum]|uniref:uncharacterized protein n=1 Tax=Cutaneotrichosporon oleaginosum TaxID=879819 RepID=UPI001325B61D|nr:hypothetical protein COLE_02829 [Cutaneotrichosporon oleaginosum]